MRLILVLIPVVLLAACGADGLPERPQGGQTDGIIFSGEARMGMSYNSAPRLAD